MLNQIVIKNLEAIFFGNSQLSCCYSVKLNINEISTDSIFYFKLGKCYRELIDRWDRGPWPLSPFLTKQKRTSKLKSK